MTPADADRARKQHQHHQHWQSERQKTFTKFLECLEKVLRLDPWGLSQVCRAGVPSGNQRSEFTVNRKGSYWLWSQKGIQDTHVSTRTHCLPVSVTGS